MAERLIPIPQPQPQPQPGDGRPLIREDPVSPTITPTHPDPSDPPPVSPTITPTHPDPSDPPPVSPAVTPTHPDPTTSGRVVLTHNALLFRVRRSIRYHSRRQGYFDRWHQLVLFFALVFSVMPVLVFKTDLAQSFPLWVPIVPPMLISLFASLDLIVGFSQKARAHTDFIRQFTDLERQLVAPDGSKDATVAFVHGEVLKLEATEPPVLRVLDTLCRNELMRATGYSRKEQIHVGIFQRCFAQFFDLNAHTLHPLAPPKKLPAS